MATRHKTEVGTAGLQQGEPDMPHQRSGNNGLDVLARDRAAQVSRISSESHDCGELESLSNVSRVLLSEELEAPAVRRWDDTGSLVATPVYDLAYRSKSRNAVRRLPGTSRKY